MRRDTEYLRTKISSQEVVLFCRTRQACHNKMSPFPFLFLSFSLIDFYVQPGVLKLVVEKVGTTIIAFIYVNIYCVKSVDIQNYSGPYFPAFELSTERHSVSLCVQSEWRKIWTRITPNMDTFYAVIILSVKKLFPMLHFHTLEKIRKPSEFLIFSGVILEM